VAIEILKKDGKSPSTLGQAYLKKAALYYNWAKDRENGEKYDAALKNYQYSSDFYKLARTTFAKAKNESGLQDATRGFDDANLRKETLNTKVQNSGSPAP
jgi:hypothetical protein